MKREIKCPKCGTAIQLDEETYDSIANQVRDNEFLEKIAKREKEYKERLDNAIEYAKKQKELEYAVLMNDKDKEAAMLKQEIADIKNKANQACIVQTYKYIIAINANRETIIDLQKKLEINKEIMDTEVFNAVAKERERFKKTEMEVVALKKEVSAKESEKELAITVVTQKLSKEVTDKENEIKELRQELSAKETEKNLR